MNLKTPQATSKGYIEVNPYGAFDWSYPTASHGAEGYRATTATSHQPSCAKTKYMCMKESKNDPQIIQAGTIVYPDHSREHQQDFVQHEDGISRGIAAGHHASTPHLLKTYIDMEQKEKQLELPEELKGRKFRIRKLTPRECFRLMGVDDADIDKIQESGLSNSAQYKLAGNSIVVDVLYHLFRKMFIETDVDAVEEGTQLTLF